jgi:hypothetical protein
MNTLTTSHENVLLKNFSLKLEEEYSTETAIPNNSSYEIKSSNIFKVLKITRSYKSKIANYLHPCLLFLDIQF